MIVTYFSKWMFQKPRLPLVPKGFEKKGEEEVLLTAYNGQRWNTRWRIHSSSLSQHLLPHLNHSLPEILSFYSVAISAHLRLNNIIHHKHLLKDSAIHHLKGGKKNHTPSFFTFCLVTNIFLKIIFSNFNT